jgi:AcrR family transcriptional regulator
MKMMLPPDSTHPPEQRTVRVFGRRSGVAIETRYPQILTVAAGMFARRGFHQASTREIARAAGLSLAGLYHYVGGKDELLFLVLDRALDTLLARLDEALSTARTPEAKLLALIRTHLDFAFHHPDELRIINRDYELLGGAKRAEIAARRQAYVQRGLVTLRRLDPHDRSGDELLSATNLLLGMLNGIGRRPFIQSSQDVHALACQVGALFLYGFLERSAIGTAPAEALGDEHGD